MTVYTAPPLGHLPVVHTQRVEEVIAPVWSRLIWEACGPSPILQASVSCTLDVAYQRHGHLFWVGGVPAKERRPGWVFAGTAFDHMIRGAYAYRPDRIGG